MYAVRKTLIALPPIFKLVVAFAVVNVLLIAVISSSQFRVFRNTAIVKSINIGVYWDVNCTDPVGGIDWGVIEPDENKTVEVYVRNEGNWEATLSIWAANWSSLEVEGFMSFTSDYQGQPLGVNQVLPVAFVLSVSAETKDVDSFAFDIVIEATG